MKYGISPIPVVTEQLWARKC